MNSTLGYPRSKSLLWEYFLNAERCLTCLRLGLDMWNNEYNSPALLILISAVANGEKTRTLHDALYHITGNKVGKGYGKGKESPEFYYAE